MTADSVHQRRRCRGRAGSSPEREKVRSLLALAFSPISPVDVLALSALPPEVTRCKGKVQGSGFGAAEVLAL